MERSNFLFLDKNWSKLSALGKDAEKYAFSDPQSSVVKLRCFAELIVGEIYRELRIPESEKNDFFSRLENWDFKQTVEKPIIDKLHAIRIKGNKAAHKGEASSVDSVWLLEEAYLVASWFYKTRSGQNAKDLPSFLAPEADQDAEEKLATKNVELKDQLSQQTEDLKKALHELELAQEAERLAQKQLTSFNQEVYISKLEEFKKASTRATWGLNLEEDKIKHRINIHDVFAEYSLTTDQSELLDKLSNFLKNQNDNVFLLKGYAGTGKTFMIKGLTEYLNLVGRNYILAAPTGKASKVIANKTNSTAYTIHKTIYSFKNVIEYQDESMEGTETFKFYADLDINKFSDDTIYIIDESSMISDVYQESEFFRFGSGFLLKDLLRFINIDHNDHNKKIIFIGDNAQLPPVNMNFSPALDTEYLSKNHNIKSSSYELTGVVRQGNNSGILENSTIIRDAISQDAYHKLDIKLDHSDIEHIEYEDLIPKYIDSCAGKIGPDSIVIAFSNKDVTEYNKRIRECFFPDQTEICSGDKVMAINNCYQNGMLITNGDFGLVRSVLNDKEIRKISLKRKVSKDKVDNINISLAFRDVEVGFRDLDGTPRFFQTKIIENLLYSDKPTLSSDETKALYIDFCMRNGNLNRNSLEFKEKLRSDPYFNAMRLKFGYAITCHKAQGSEWKNVFVKCKTYQDQLNPSYFRWLYTAITRASERLYLLDEPHIKVGSGIEIVDVPKPVMVKIEENSSEKSIGMEGAASSEELFGIPSSNHFLFSILTSVKECISNFDISITDIQHNQYQEIYSFRQEDNFARINLSYNKKNKVTKIFCPETNELSENLLETLKPLQNRIFKSNTSSIEKDDFDFSEPFLCQFHERIMGICKRQGINVAEVKSQQFFQRYTFTRHNDVAVFNFYYNGKNQFTKCIPQYNDCNSEKLISDLNEIVTVGLSE